MNSHDWEGQDLLYMKWAEGDSGSQLIYNPYLDDIDTGIDETFNQPTDWKPSLFENQISSSTGIDVRLTPDPLHLDTSSNFEMIDQGFSMDTEDEDNEANGDMMPIYQTTSVTPSTIAKNSFIPNWQSRIDGQTSDCPNTLSLVARRQKRNKATGQNTASINLIGKARRRSRIKLSNQTKAYYSHTDTSPDTSSPEMSHSPDLDKSIIASKSKTSHNMSEKKYRSRLNGYFDTLLAAIPGKPGGFDGDDITGIAEKKISKGEVLVMALGHIRTLEKQRDMLEEEKKILIDSLEHLKRICAKLGGEAVL